jgi:hypothetical protein
MKRYKDKSRIITAISTGCITFSKLDPFWKRDAEVALCAIDNYYPSIQDVDSVLLSDAEFLYRAVQSNPMCVTLIPGSVDRDLLLTALRLDGTVYERVKTNQYVSHTGFYADRELLMAAIQTYPGAIYWANDTLRKDREIAEQVVKRDGLLLHCLDPLFMNDEPLVTIAVRSNANIIKSLPDTMRQDKSIALIAVKQNGALIQYLDRQLQSDPDVVYAAVTSPHCGYRWIPNQLKLDRELTQMVLKNSGDAIEWVPDQFRDDQELVIDAIREDPWAIRWASTRLKGDPLVIATAMEKDPDTFLWATPELQIRPEFLYKSLSNNFNVFYQLEETIKRTVYADPGNICKLFGLEMETFD